MVCRRTILHGASRCGTQTSSPAQDQPTEGSESQAPRRVERYAPDGRPAADRASVCRVTRIESRIQVDEKFEVHERGVLSKEEGVDCGSQGASHFRATLVAKPEPICRCNRSREVGTSQAEVVQLPRAYRRGIEKPRFTRGHAHAHEKAKALSNEVEPTNVVVRSRLDLMGLR
jgi:hypothetical protein